MNLLDVILLACIAFFTWLGTYQRPLRQATISGGTIIGLIVGSTLYHKLVFLSDGSAGRTAVLLLLILAVGFVAFDIMQSIGRRIEKRHPHTRSKLTPLQRGVSGSLAGATGFVLAWASLGVVSVFSVAYIQNLATTSAILTTTQRFVQLPTFFQEVASLISPFSAPRAFASGEPTFDGSKISQDFSSLDTAITDAKSSVFKISSWGCGTTSQGSGFLVDNRSIVTNAHVVAGANRISVEDKDGSMSYMAQVIWFDPDLDIAVLTTSVTLPQTPLRIQSGTLPAGAVGSVIGYPGGNELADTDAIVLDSLRAKGYDIYDKKTVTRSILALRASIVPGNSGSPLIGSSGQVMGLVFGHSLTQNHTGYALTAEQISPIITAALKRNVPVSSGSCTE